MTFSHSLLICDYTTEMSHIKILNCLKNSYFYVKTIFFFNSKKLLRIFSIPDTVFDISHGLYFVWCARSSRIGSNPFFRYLVIIIIIIIIIILEVLVITSRFKFSGDGWDGTRDLSDVLSLPLHRSLKISYAWLVLSRYIEQVIPCEISYNTNGI
jgi:hypothetical protein